MLGILLLDLWWWTSSNDSVHKCLVLTLEHPICHPFRWFPQYWSSCYWSCFVYCVSELNNSLCRVRRLLGAFLNLGRGNFSWLTLWFWYFLWEAGLIRVVVTILTSSTFPFDLSISLILVDFPLDRNAVNLVIFPILKPSSRASPTLTISTNFYPIIHNILS